jgi:hypothetical protein
MSSPARQADSGLSTAKRIFQGPYREVTTTPLENERKLLRYLLLIQ